MLIPEGWGFGGWQLPAVQISVEMPGVLLWLMRQRGEKGRGAARDQGALLAGVRVPGATGLGVEGSALVSLLSSSACPLWG